MPKKNILFLRQVLLTQYNHWVLYGLIFWATELGIYYAPDLNTLYPIGWAVCGLIPLAQYYIRRYCHNLLLFVLSHAALCALAAALPVPHLYLRILYVISSIFYLIHSFVVRFSDNHYENGLLPLYTPYLLAGGAWIFLGLMKMEGFQNKLLYYAIALSLFYFLCYLMEQYLDAIATASMTAGYMPKSQIFKKSLGMYIAFAGICVICFYFCLQISLFDGLWICLKRVLFLTLAFLIQHLLTHEEPDLSQAEIPRQELEALAPTQAQEAFWLWDLLAKIATFLCLLALFLLALRGLALLYRFLCEKLARRSGDGELLPEHADQREKIQRKRQGKRKSKKSAPTGFGIADRIRRVYKYTLLRDRALLLSEEGIGQKRRDNTALSLFTAADYARASGRWTVSEIYEKARYSDKPCTKEDYKAIKEASK